MVSLSSSPSRYPVLRPENLGPMAVLESISADTAISDRLARFKALWATYDPPNAAQYDVGALEFDPIVILTENAAYFEAMLRDRVNQACRNCTLAFGYGSNLDALASNYPGGVPRLDGETDDRYRRRIWASPNPLSPHGTAEAYEFWALTALPALRDARTVKIRPSLADNPVILIACLLDSVGYGTPTWNGPSTIVSQAITHSPSPTQQDLLAVRLYLRDEARSGMTDEYSVNPPKIVPIDYRVQVDLFPGIDAASSLSSINTALLALIESQRWLGYDHTLAAISAAAKISGVHNVIIKSPEKDVLVNNDWFVQVNSLTVEYVGRAE